MSMEEFSVMNCTNGSMKGTTLRFFRLDFRMDEGGYNERFRRRLDFLGEKISNLIEVTLLSLIVAKK